MCNWVFPLQALKEVFAHQLITALMGVRAQYPVRLGPTPISLGSRCAPGALLATTVQRRLATSLSTLVHLDSTALMVSKNLSWLCFFMNLTKNVHVTNTTTTEIWLPCTPRYKACHSVSLSSWILQPRAYDSESGQLLALSSRTLLWEGEADQSVWKMQGWSVTASLCISTKDTIAAIVSQCQDFVLCTSLFVSWGWQSSPKQSGRLRGQEQRVHIKHEAPQLNTSHISHYFSSPPHFHSRTSAPTAAFR